MKKIVVDASVCLKWVFNEEDSDSARQLLKKYEGGTLLLMAPSLWEYEITNALTTAVRRKKISSKKSELFLQLFMQATPQIISISQHLGIILENAKKYTLSAYDSAYVTLAKESGSTLISSDRQLFEKVGNPKIAVLLGDYRT